MTSRLSSQTKRHLRHAGMATFALGFAALFGTNSAIAADDGPNASPEVVYGSDSRREVYSLVPGRKQLAAPTVALVTGDPSLAGKPVTLPLQPDLQTENKLCAGQRFAKQPVPAFCSGALVAPDIVLTAGHCVKVPGSNEGVPLSKMLFLFGFDMLDATHVKIGFPGKDVYAAKSLLKRVENDDADYALIRLDRKVAGRPALAVAPTEPMWVGKQLFVIGHPSGLPTKLAAGASIKRVDSTTFTSNLDTFEGNSGSPIFSAGSNAIVGILDSGKKDYVWRGSCRVVNTLPNNKGGEDATRISALARELAALK